MITAIDTNALVAVLYDDEHADASESELRHAYSEGSLVVAPIVFAELAADGQFEGESGLSRFLDDLGIRITEPSTDALFRAGERFMSYLDRRPDGFQCPSCGEIRGVSCDSCGEALAPRQHIAANFVIGAHASVDADTLISFDSGFFATYFPELTVVP